MLEGILTGLLNKYLGDFIEGLDAEQLKLGVWGGEIHLTDLSVKPSALDFLHLPVCVRSGRLGSLRIKVNWRALLSQPVEVELTGLSVVACSKDLMRGVDDAAEQARALTTKLAALRAMEDFQLSAALQAALAGKSAEHKAAETQGMVGRMVASIIDNIQISVRDVHVRFEHAGEADGSGGLAGGSPTALGIVLHGLRVCSIDEAGNERFVAATASASDPTKMERTFKRAELCNAYVYFNTARSSAGSSSARSGGGSAFSSASSSSLGSSTRAFTEHDMRSPFLPEVEVGNGCDFLVRPVSGQVRLELNKNAPTSASDPPSTRVLVNLQGIELTVDEVQYHALMKVLASISAASSADRIVAQRYTDRFREGTPQDQARYTALYRRTLAPSWEDELNAVEKTELERLEKELAHEDLATYRALVLSLLRAQFPARTLSKRVSREDASFMSRWVGKGVSAAKAVVTLGMAGGNEQRVEGPDVELSDAETEAIIQAALEAPPRAAEDPLPPIPKTAEELAAEAAGDGGDGTVPRGYVGLALELQQAHLSASLLNKSRRSLLSLVVSHTNVKFEQRKAGGMLAALSIGNIALQDQTTPNTLYPDLFGKSSAQREKMSSLATSMATSPRSTSAGLLSPNGAFSPTTAGAVAPLPSPVVVASAPLIDMLYETQPLDAASCNGADARVVLHVLPSLLVVHARWLSRLMAFFATPAADLHKPEQVAELGSWEAKTLAQLKASTSASVQAAFEQHSSLHIVAHIAMPSVLVAAAPNILHSHVLVADLGLLSVHTVTQSAATIKLLRDTIAINEALAKAKKEAANAPSSAAAAASSSSVGPSATAAAVPLLSESEMRQCYDQIHVRLQDVQLFMSQATSAVGGRGFDARNTLPLLGLPLCAQVRVDLSIAPSVSWMAPMRVDGEIAALELTVSSAACHRAMAIANSMTNMSPPPPPPAVQAAIKAAATSPQSMMRSRNLVPTLPAASPRSRTSRINARGKSGRSSPQLHVFDRPYAPSISLSPSATVERSFSGDFDEGASPPLGPQLPSLTEKEFLGMEDLTELFQSEREARALMADLDADGNGSVTREEYMQWVLAKKHMRKNNKGMEIEFRVGAIKIKLIDDRRPIMQPQQQLSISSPIGSRPPSSAVSASTSSAGPFHPPRDVLVVSLGSLLFRQSSLAYSGSMHVELSSLMVKDALTQRQGDFRIILSSRAPSSAPSKSAAREAEHTGQPFLRVDMHSVSAEHPDFGFSSLAAAEAAERAQIDDGSDAAAAQQPLLPSDIDVELGNIVLLVDPHAINDVALFVLNDFLPKPDPAAATASAGSTPAAAPVPPASATAAAAAHPSSAAAASAAGSGPSGGGLPSPVLVMSPVHASALSSPTSPTDSGSAVAAALLAEQQQQQQNLLSGVPVAPAISMRLRVRMSTFQLLLTYRGRHVAKLATQNLSVALWMRAAHVGGGMLARVRIPKLALVDQLGARPVAVLIGLEPVATAAAARAAAPPCLEVEYTMFSPAAGAAFGFASHVRVALRGVKLVQDFRFYGSVLAWLWATLALPFIAGDKPAAAAAPAAPALEDKLAAPASASAPSVSAASPATPSLPFLKFSVLLEDVEIVFPNFRTNDPTHRLTFHLRQLDVTNHALVGAEAKAGRLVEYQQFAVGIGGATLLCSAFPGPEAGSGAATVMHLERMGVAVSMTQALTNSLDVRVDAHRIDVTLVQDFYAFLMGNMLWAILDNLTGLWAPPPLDPNETKAVGPAAPAAAADVANVSAASGSAAKESNWIRVFVNFRSMAVTLSKNKGWSSRSDGLITVLGHNMSVRYWMDSTGGKGQGVEAAFEALEVIDDSMAPTTDSSPAPSIVTSSPPAKRALTIVTPESKSREEDNDEDDEERASPSGVELVRPEYRRMVTLRDQITLAAPLEQRFRSAFEASRAPVGLCDLSELILAHKRPSSSSAPLEGAMFASWFQEASTGATDIEVRLEHLAYCVCSMVVLEIGAFFVVPAEATVPAPAAVPAPTPAPSVASVGQHKALYGGSSPTDPAQEETYGMLLMGDALLTGAVQPSAHVAAPAGLVMRVKLSMPQAVVQLISSVREADARALNVAFDLHLEFAMGLPAAGAMSASVQLDNLRAVEGTRAASQGGFPALIASLEKNNSGVDGDVPREMSAPAAEPPPSNVATMVLRPVDVHVAFLSEPSRLFGPQQNSMTVDVGVTDLLLNVGYQQYLLLMGAMAVMFPSKPTAVPSAGTPSKPTTPAAPAESSAPSSTSTSASRDAASPVAAVPSALPAALHFSEQNIHVQVASVQVHVINDAYAHSLYLMKVGVGNLLAKVHKFGDSGGLFARLDLTADVFNPRVLAWEPLLEPWDVIFSQHINVNTRTPQEYLLLNQPRHKVHAITQELASETVTDDIEDSSSLRSSDNTALSSSFGTHESSRNNQYANRDKSMSIESITEALTPFTDLSVSSSRPFNVTVSVAAVQDLLDFMALLPDIKLKKTPQRTLSAPPYRVENHTNLDLELYMTASNAGPTHNPSLGFVERRRESVTNLLKTASAKAMSAVGLLDDLGLQSTAAEPAVMSPSQKALLVRLAAQRVRVPAYSEADLEFPESIAPNQRAFVVQFQHAATGSASFGAITSRLAEFTLAVSHNKSVRLDLSPRRRPDDDSSADPVYIVADMSVRRGVRVVSLHSDVAIGNQTDGALAIRTTMLSEHILPRGKIFYLPVMAASQRRHVQVKPYDDASSASTANTDDAPMSPGRLHAQAMQQQRQQAKAEPMPICPDVPGSSALSPRMLGPVALEEDHLLFNWSGELVCDPAVHKERRSEQTGAMHYRCGRRSAKLMQRRGSASSHMLRKPLVHSGSVGAIVGVPSLTATSNVSPGLPLSPGAEDGAASTEANSFNFTVYASVWKKKEQRRMDAEEAEKLAKLQEDDSGPGASSLSPEPLDAPSSDSNVSFGELAKKRYCSLYYIRNPLTIENFLAGPVGVRLYHTDRQRDEDLRVVSGMLSPPTSAAPNGRYLGPPEEKAAKSKGLFDGVPSFSSSSNKPSGPPRLIEEVLLDRGQAFPSHAVSTHLDTLMSLRLPGVNAGWSQPTLLRLSREPQTVKFHLHDTDPSRGGGAVDATGPASSTSSSSSSSSSHNGVLTILGEVSVVQGHVHVILYTHYWLFDLTNLGLLLLNDETRLPLPRLTDEKTWLLDGEEGLIEDRMIEKNNAELSSDPAPSMDKTLRSSDSSSSSSGAAAAAALALATLEHDVQDVVQPFMFSSKHHLSKKQRVRLQAGWVQELDVRKARTAPAPGSLSSRVQNSFRGPTGDPAGHAAPLLAGSPNYLVQWSGSSAPFSMEHVGTTESVSIASTYAMGVCRSLATEERIPVRAPGEGATFEVVCSVSNGPGRFYRTKQVTFAPRFVMVNKLSVPVLVRQYAPYSFKATAAAFASSSSIGGGEVAAATTLLSSIVRIGAGETQVFHWPHPVRDHKPWVCFKREGPGMDGWHWTGFLDLCNAGDSPMLVTHSRSHQSWFAHIDVRIGSAGTAFVLIDELKQQGLVEHLALELPFLVQNRSATHTIRFRQARDKPEFSSRHGAFMGTLTSNDDGTTAVSMTRLPTSPRSPSGGNSATDASSFDWFEVPPHGVMPWIWEEPLQEHVLLVQFSVLDPRSRKVVDWQKEKRVKFDNDGDEEDATLRVTRAPTADSASASSSSSTSTGDTAKVYYFTETSGPTQVLVFSDRSHRKRNTLLSGMLDGVGGIVSKRSNSGKGDIAGLEASPETTAMSRTTAGATAPLDEEGDEFREVPDDAGKTRAGAARFGPSPNHSPEEPDGGLAVYDPTNESEADRKLRLELGVDNHADDALAVVPSQQKPKANGAGSAKLGGPPPSASSVPADFTGSGVLQVTVISATGFKPSRQHMFAGVVFAGMRQRTEVAHNTREPQWGRRMNFATEFDTDEFKVKTCGCFSSTLKGRPSKKKAKKGLPVDPQVVYVNIYEKTAFGGDHFLGCASVRLRDIGFEHTDAWFDVLKNKGATRGMERRGKVHLGLWWQRDGAHAAHALEEEEVALALAADGSPHRSASTAAASSGGSGGDLNQMLVSSPRLHRLHSTPAQLDKQRQLWRLTQGPAYEACDASSERVWSEYRIRFVTTALMKELGQVHQLDFMNGRLVAYVTCPLMPRAFSVLMMDHGVYNMSKKWRQDIRFCLPHQQGKKFRQDAIVRITLFFFRSENAVRSLHRAQSASLAAGGSASASTAPASSSNPYGNPLHGGDARPISGHSLDLYAHPVRVAEATFDLMSVREVGDVLGKVGDDEPDEDNEEKQALEDEREADALDARAVEQAEAEEEIAAGRRKGSDAAAKKPKKKSKKQLLAEEKHRQRTEWQRKWIPLVSPIKTNAFPVAAPSPAGSPSASAPPTSHAAPRVPALCLNVKRTVIDRARNKSYRPTTTAIKVVVPMIGLSIVDTSPEEVCYFSVRGIGLSLNDSNWQTTVSATIDNIQLDNLLSRAAFPVVFNKTILHGSESSGAPPQPFVQVALNRKKTRLPNLSIFPYFSILVQKMDVRIEEANIWRTLTFINQLAVRMGGDLAQDLQPAGLTRRWSNALTVPPTGTQKMFFKLLHVQPLALNVSFAAQPGLRQSTSSYHINPLFTAINMLEAGIGNIDQAPLRLNGKLIENALGTTETIVWSLVSHYVQQAVMEGYKLLGSVEFIGNPVGLAHELGTGTLDFFAEPAKGLMISPAAFSSGLAKGSGSLIKGTVGGLMSAASAVTNSASKVMATASGDEAFMASQAAARSGHQPEHLADGLKMGVTALGNSLFSGVTGVFLDPLAGARKEGVLGFGKGLVKGVAGLAFKPLAGVLDLTTNTLKGIGNTASYLLDGPVEALMPVRPQRYIDPSSGVIQPFDLAAAEAHDTRWQRKNKPTKGGPAGSSASVAAASSSSAK